MLAGKYCASRCHATPIEDEKSNSGEILMSKTPVPLLTKRRSSSDLDLAVPIFP
jgi:MinD superfamily P-loop ATPase